MAGSAEQGAAVLGAERGLVGSIGRALLVGALLLVLVDPPSVRAAAPVLVPVRADGFRVESHTTYALDPPGGAVHVAFEATLTNQRPDQVVGSLIRQFYLPDYGVPVLAEATGLVATKSDGSSLSVRLEPTESPIVSLAIVDLRPDVYYGSSQTFRLTYDLPGQAPRSRGVTRLNSAYATFPALAIGDPDLTSVEILVPDGFEVELVGDRMQESARDGHQVFRAEAIADPRAWEVLVSARDDSELIARTVDLGDEDVRVLGWPDDPEWADFAAEQVEDGVPAIEALTGLEWPATSTIDVVETASPYLYGYAGWYRPDDSVIEVGDELDARVVLHELGHVWFNDDLFRGRWINEAFADQVAAMAIAELGGDELVPEPVTTDDPGRLPLNDWSDPDLQAGVSADQERYGYNASWSVLHGIVAEIGSEKLVEVIQAADAGVSAYQGPGVPESATRTFDWRELLDLLEVVGGSTSATPVFEDLVVGADEAGIFAERLVARETYADLVESGDGWLPPAAVRQAMIGWRFTPADQLMAQAVDVLSTKADLVEVAADLEVSDRLALQEAYESAKNLVDLGAEADDALAAARRLRSAEQAQADGAGPIGALGLLLSGVDADLDAAQEAFDDGEYATVVAESAAVEAAVDGAVTAGLVRLGALVVGVALVVLARRWWRGRRARRRIAAAEAAEPPVAEVGASEDFER